jgi:putative ABC transport system permease protein
MRLWLFYRIFVRRHLRSPLRAILLACALSIATSLWLAVAHVGFVGTQTFEEAVGISPQKFTYQITPVSGRIPQEVIERCIAPLHNTTSFAAVRRESGTVMSGQGSSIVRVFVTSAYGEEVVVGAGQDDEIFLSKESRDQVGAGIGDDITCMVAGRVVQGKVGALPSNLPKVPGIAVVIPMPLYQKSSVSSLSATRSNEGFDSVFLSPRGERYTTLSGLQRWLDQCGAEASNKSSQSLRVESTQEVDKRNSSLLNAYRTNIGILALMALAVSSILVAHASQISLLNVVREIAIVRILGVSAGFCSLCILLEAVLLGIVGVVLAVIAGFPITRYLVSYLSGTAYEMYRLPLAQSDTWFFTLSVYGGVGVVMVVTTLAGATISAFRAAALPLGAGAKREQTSRFYIPFRIVFAVVISISILLCVLGWYALYGLYSQQGATPLSTRDYLPTLGVSISSYGFVAVASLFGLVVIPLAVLLVRPVVRGVVYTLSPLLTLHTTSRHGAESRLVKKEEPTGLLNLQNSSVHPRRSLAGTSWALSDLFSIVCATLAVSLIVSISLMVGSFRETLDVWTQQRLQGDLFLSVNLQGASDREAQLPDTLRIKLLSLEGVKEIRNYREIKLTSQGTKVALGATQVRKFFEEGAYRFTDLNPKLLEDSSRSMLISEGAMRRLGIAVGDSVKVDTGRGEISLTAGDAPDGRVDFRVAGILREYSTELPLFIISEETFTQLFPGEGSQSFTLFIDPSLSPDTLQERVLQNVSSAVAVRRFSELRSYVLEMFDRTFLITGAVRWIVFFLAGIGLLITFLQQVWEQRRTIKVMRTLGYSRIQIATLWGANAFETSLIAAFSGILGGGIVGWGLVYLVNPASFGWSLDFYLTSAPIVISMLFILMVSACVLTATWYMVKFVIDGVAISDE